MADIATSVLARLKNKAKGSEVFTPEPFVCNISGLTVKQSAGMD